MNSALCSILNIRYPIMQGAFQWLATPELAAAVSNAGGLGTISASLYKTKEELLDAIAQTKALANNPFCVNISMFPEVVEGEATWDFIEACCQAKVPLWPPGTRPGARSSTSPPPSGSPKRRQRPGSMWCLWWALSAAARRATTT